MRRVQFGDSTVNGISTRKLQISAIFINKKKKLLFFQGKKRVRGPRTNELDLF